MVSILRKYNKKYIKRSLKFPEVHFKGELEAIIQLKSEKLSKYFWFWLS